MDEWIEIEGRNRVDAIERACNALNTNETHLEYELVTEGGKTRIRARKLEAPREVAKVPPPREPQAREPEVAQDAREPEKAAEPRREKEREKEAEPRVFSPVDGPKIKETLETLVRFIDQGAQVEFKETEDTVYLDIQGGDRAGLMIGKHGQTLQALQYLVARMTGLDRSDSKRLVLDSEQYRARRQESLEGMARSLATRARRSGRPVSAEPMSAADRRILHVTLAEDPDVTTKSVGEGPGRKVLVVPRRGGGGGGRNTHNPRGPRGRFGRGMEGGREEEPREAEPRRRLGPPPRKHDSFDAPPEPTADFFEEELDAPIAETPPADDKEE
ncbi:MAG: R3H domain-containing nucleic acid-binding protein [Pseudomonadota bacterium]